MFKKILRAPLVCKTINLGTKRIHKKQGEPARVRGNKTYAKIMNPVSYKSKIIIEI